MDLVGPLPSTKNGNRYIIMLVDYFSKWPEAAPLTNKKADSVAQFLYTVICRYLHAYNAYFHVYGFFWQEIRSNSVRLYCVIFKEGDLILFCHHFSCPLVKVWLYKSSHL